MKKRLLTVAFLMGAWGAYAQVGIGTISPNKSSQLEIVAKDKGLLIPQVPLKGLTDKTTILNGNVSSLLVWNTSNVADVTPGYYYWMQNKWLRILDTDTLSELDSNTTNSSLSVVGDQLVLTDSDGNKVSIALKSINLPTSLVNNGDGTYTYTSEDGTTSTINVPSDVINNFYDIVNNGDVLQDLITVLGDTYVGGNVYYDGTKFTYVDQAGNSHVINFKDIVKANETITKLVNNNNGTYTYTNEAGESVTIDVPADVINNFEDIITNTNVLKQLVKHLTNTTVGGNVFYDGDKFTYIDENNVVKNITFEEIIKANETLTILNYNDVTNVLTYKDEDGIDTVIDLNIGSISYDSSENRITYKDGNGQSTPLNLNQTSLIYDKITKVLTYTDSKGIAHAIDLGALVAAHETVTTLVNNNDGTYTYTNEAGVAVKIDVPADVINNFEDIINEGDVQTILNEYIIKKVGGNVSYDGDDFYYVDNSGNLVKIDIIDKVVNNIKNEGDIYDEIINLINNKSDILLDNGNGTFTHTSVNGTSVTFDANTTSVTVVDGVYTFLNGKGDIITTIDTNVDALDVTYDNTVSGLTSENVKEAIDELANTIGTSKGDLIVGGGIEFTGGRNGLAKLLSDASIQIADGGVTSSKIGDKAVSAIKLDGGLGTEGRIGVANANGDVIYTSLEEAVQANETLTVLAYNNTLNQLTYTDEDSTPKVIDLNVGSISYSATANAITYTDEKGIPTVLTLNETSLVYDVLTNVLTYTNSKGEAETIDLGALVQANETLTVLAYNSTLNQLTYTDEDSTPKVIDLNVGSISYSAAENAITYTDEKGVPTVLTLNETSLVYDVLTNVLTYTNSKGEAETIDLGALVQANETLTVLTDNGDGTFTYTDEDKGTVTFNANTTSVTTVGGIYTFKDGNGDVITTINTNANSIIFNNSTNGFTSTNVQAAIEELLSKINTVDGTKGNLSVTGGIAFTTGSDGANKLLANSSIEIADGGVTEIKLAPNSVTTTKIADDAVTTAKIQAGVNGDILVTDGGEVKWMSKTAATTNVLSLSGNQLTSTVNGVDSSVTLRDAVTSTKGITSNNITVTGGAGATLTDVTLNVTPGTNGQVMVTKNGNTAWVDQSEIVPTTTNTLELTDNNLVSTVNGVATTPAVDLSKYLDNTDDQVLSNFEIVGTDLSITIENGNTVTVPLADIAAAVDTNTDNQQITSFTLTGNTLKIILERGGEKEIDLSALQVTYLADGINTTVSGSGTALDKYKVNVSPEAIQANQLKTVVAQGTGIIVTPVTVANTTTYTVAANPTTIALNGDVTGNASATTLSKIQGKDLEATTPIEGNILVFEGNKWVTKAPSVNAGNVTNAKNLTAADAATATIEVVTGGTGATLVETSLRVKAESITTTQIKNGTIQPIDIADAGSNQVLVTGSDNKPTWVNQSTLQVTANNGLTKTLNNVQLGGALIKATDITTSATNTLAVKGLDKTKTQGTDATGVTQHLLAVDKNGDIVKALKAAMPKFFYMPSVLVPTAESQLGQAGVTFDNGTRVGTINLYTIYSAQFGSPVMSSGGTLPVLPASELNYHITYATPGVFTINSITPAGLMTYTVASGADINNGSFINIVFSVNED